MSEPASLTRSQLSFIVEHYRRGFVGFFRGYAEEDFDDNILMVRDPSSATTERRLMELRQVCFIYFICLGIAVLIFLGVLIYMY